MNLQENIQRIKEVMGINEQIPDSRFETVLSSNEIKQYLSKLSNLSFHDAVDVISAVIDTVPGLGNLLSLGIDLTHGLAYLVKFYFSNSDEEKLENCVLGLLTLGMAFVPIGGNSLPIMARQGMKQILRKTPQELLLLGRKAGIYKGAIVFLSKQKWKYSIFLLMTKLLGNQVDNFVAAVLEKLNKVYGGLKNNPLYKSISEVVKYVIELLNEFKSDLPIIKKLIKTNEI